MTRPAGSIKGALMYLPPKHKADVAISQVNPVSTTLYEVLPTTRNVRLIGLAANITWAVTQPTPLEIVVTIDGVTILMAQANPVSATNYLALVYPQYADFVSGTDGLEGARRAFLLEGRSVRVQVRVTWAVTQPTPLVCRVKYAKW